LEIGHNHHKDESSKDEVVRGDCIYGEYQRQAGVVKMGFKRSGKWACGGFHGENSREEVRRARDVEAGMRR
jgi:hypothetical protein